ncbi:piggyBac transposable element-derived protein 3 [Biomphalaria pfeifferi]|uniref:PiggyBac transposable element-derived protein 3 n=1 Tax=Biomphalaria pfeifferi TaxID=112525 RepID=A0AAD8C2E6_BIOPF|nr:piggyBac transposable element-derived protein 3 [Biomphalaria pfeifferi]
MFILLSIRFGFKLWALTTSTAYLIQAVPYQGASTGKTIPELGMGGSVVMDLISELPRSTKYNLYFDNLFISLSLMDRLTKEGFGATGTLRSIRTEKASKSNVKKSSWFI